MTAALIQGFSHISKNCMGSKLSEGAFDSQLRCKRWAFILYSKFSCMQEKFEYNINAHFVQRNGESKAPSDSLEPIQFLDICENTKTKYRISIHNAE